MSSSNPPSPHYWGEGSLGSSTGRKSQSFSSVDITERQLECLTWVQAGKSATDIGGILGISGRTVESHLARICEHLGVKTRLQAVLKAQAIGLISSLTP